MSQSPFQKFVTKKKNSAVKESFRQEKKKIKKERAEYFDKIWFGFLFEHLIKRLIFL